MSGGVDSSVSALLLKQQGYKVFGVHMINWDKQLNELELDAECENSSQDLKETREIAKILDIPLKIYNFSHEYWEDIFCPFITNLQNNLISNPDVLCNLRIKFGILLQKVKEDFGEDVKLATGHYAKITRDLATGRNYLEVCKNVQKDQTYFLSRLKEQQLREIIFPLSDIESKKEIRQLARSYGFPNWNKRDSTGICFIGKRNFKNFAKKFLNVASGNIVDIENNKILGRHEGVQFYSINQRKGTNISGQIEKYYVCKKDCSTDTLYVCKESKRSEYLISSRCAVKDLHWINEIPELNSEILMKLKYTGKFVRGKVETISSAIWIFSHEPSYTSSPGQFTVFYSKDGKRCLGSGIFKQTPPSI